MTAALAGVAAAACAVAVLAAPAVVAEPREPDAATVAAVVRAHLGPLRLPGAAVAVIHDGRVLHAAGYGHDSRGEPVTGTTPMRLGAVSESFTAMAVMQLAAPGFVGLDDPVAAHLPEFTTADPRSARITVRRLLDHTSGLPATHDAPGDRPGSLQEAVAGLRDVTLAAEPGERRLRSELGYQVAARLLEVRTQRPFGELLWDRVLFQVGMLATSAVDDRREPVPGLVDGHGRFLGLSRPRQEPDRFVAGSGGIVSTAEDVAAWLAFNAGHGLRTVLTGAQLREVQRLGWEDRSRGTGPAELVLRGRTATGSATLVLLPDTRYGVAVLANSREPLEGPDGAGHSEVDALADDLVALTRGAPPTGPGLPLAFIAELLLVCAAVAAALAAATAVRRSREWARRRAGDPPGLPALRLVPCVLPLAVLALLPRATEPLVGGATFRDAALVWPTGLTAAVVVAAAGTVVLAARLRAVSPRTGR
jgi:CubicO group peptidase (beta-lactamase class C family)